MKYLTEDEIKNELNDYIYNANIKYATLLNGNWGSGKTYFVKKYINELELAFQQNKKNDSTKYKHPIYISLYGLNNISEIKNKILLSLIKNKKIKQILPLIGVCAEIGIEYLSSQTFIQISSNKINKIIDTFSKIDNLIIFFDDLERCNIDINSILGYINELVEHNNIKVIIVADEDKIGKINYQTNLELKYLISLSDNIKIEDNKEKNNSWVNHQNDAKPQFTKEEIIERAKYIFNENII